MRLFLAVLAWAYALAAVFAGVGGIVFVAIASCIASLAIITLVSLAGWREDRRQRQIGLQRLRRWQHEDIARAVARSSRRTVTRPKTDRRIQRRRRTLATELPADDVAAMYRAAGRRE